jgi:hypothetical protein
MEEDIIAIFERDSERLSLDDIVIKLWIDRGGLELKNKDDYYNDIEFFNLQNIVRNVIFDSLTQKGYFNVVREEKTQKVIKTYFEKKVKSKEKTTKR